MLRGERAGSQYQHVGLTPSKFDENSVSQIIEPGLPLAELPVGCVRVVRGASADADQPAAIRSSREGSVSAVPVSEPSLRMSFGRTVLEEVLLLHQFSKGRLGKG